MATEYVEIEVEKCKAATDGATLCTVDGEDH